MTMVPRVLGRCCVAGFVIFSLVSSTTSCRSCVRDESTGFPFRRGSVEKFESGQVAKGYLLEATVIEGVPCDHGWIRFFENGRLSSFRLAEDFAIDGRSFPAGSTIFRDEKLRLASRAGSRETRYSTRALSSRPWHSYGS